MQFGGFLARKTRGKFKIASLSTRSKRHANAAIANANANAANANATHANGNPWEPREARGGNGNP